MASFKTRVFLSVISGYFVVVALGLGLLLVSLRGNTDELIAAHREWLELGVQRLLTRWETGDQKGVNLVMDSLVEKPLIREARLSIGAADLVFSDPGLDARSAQRGWVERALVPDERVAVSAGNLSGRRGTLSVKIDSGYLIALLKDRAMPLLLASLAIFALLLAGLWLLIERQTLPLRRLADYFRRFSGSENDPEEINRLLDNEMVFGTRELAVLSDEFKATIRNILALQDEIRRQKLQSQASKIAAQVAHDIRSPLSALSLATSDLHAIPEEKRVLIRAAVNRINDIANELLEKYRSLTADPPVSEEGDSHPVSLELLPTLVDSVVSEKRSQYKTRRELNFDLRVGPHCYGIFARVAPVHFKRIISNLINNAVESIPDAGHITIDFAAKVKSVSIFVSDTGTGIPRNVLPEILKGSKSHGKTSGSGLGLPHASTWLKRWSGGLNIESEEGAGTSVEIRLPRAPAPDWFVPKITVPKGTTIVAVDDDVAIHLVWKQRFAEMVEKHRCALVHFSQDREVMAWCRQNPDRVSQALFLMDYELIGSASNGPQIIEALGIADRAILVTSLYEEHAIREVATRMGVGFVPKSMASLVPIEVKREKRVSKRGAIVLIDDEELVHMTWRTSARSAGKEIETFYEPEEFLRVEERFSRSSEIYIDRNLAGGVLGEDIARELYERGYRNLYLATGMDAGDLPELPWVKGVISKTPPWTVPSSAGQAN